MADKVTKSGVLIKSGEKGIVDITVLKGRDVEFALRDVEIHPNVRKLIYQLAEGHNEMRNMVRELLTTVEQLVDTVATVGLAVEGAHKKLEQMRKESVVDAEITTTRE